MNETTNRPNAPGAYLGTYLGRFDRRFLSHPLVPRLIAVVLLVVLVIPSFQFVVTIQKVDTSFFREKGERHRTALGRWLPTAGELAKGSDGDNPYGQGHWFPTPPLVLISLVPLWKMGYVAAAVVWSILKIGLIFAAGAILLSALRRAGTPVPHGVLLMALVFSLRPIISDIQHGNLNTFMAAWLALGVACYLRGQEARAGLFFALAVVTKITPALVLIYFLYKRRWRVCAWMMVGLVLFFIIVPGLALGFERNFTLLRAWFDMLVRPFAVDGYATLEIANQSLYGVLLRILSNAGILAVDHMSFEEAMRVGMEEMARPATAMGRLLRPAISVFILGLLAWGCRRAKSEPARRDAMRFLLEFALVFVAMLLLSERTWKHHATTLPLVFIPVWYVTACRPWTDRARGCLVAGLAAQLVLLVLSGEGLFGDRLADRMMEGGLFGWGLVICFVQTIIMTKRSPAKE